MSARDPLATLRRKLERWELEHLRTHCAELSTRLEEAEQRAWDAERRADWLLDDVNRMHDALDSDAGATHRCIGLSKAGELMVVAMERAA
jgi:hypothetical protein